MTTKHTQGPWFAANDNEVHDKLTEYDNNGARIGETANRMCVVEYPYTNKSGQIANAKSYRIRQISMIDELLGAMCRGIK